MIQYQLVNKFKGLLLASCSKGQGAKTTDDSSGPAFAERKVAKCCSKVARPPCPALPCRGGCDILATPLLQICHNVCDRASNQRFNVLDPRTLKL